MSSRLKDKSRAEEPVASEADASPALHTTGALDRAAQVVQSQLIADERPHTWRVLKELTLSAFLLYARANRRWAEVEMPAAARVVLHHLAALPTRAIAGMGGPAAEEQIAWLTTLAAPEIDQASASFVVAAEGGYQISSFDLAVKLFPHHDALRAIASHPGVVEVLDNGIDLLANEGLVGLFCSYVASCRPVLSAGARDAAAFLTYAKDTGGDVNRYRGRLTEIRTYHHFEVAALDRLLANLGDHSHARPLMIVLHSSFDWNGAFMGDPELTRLVCDDRWLTLVLEGKTLEQLATRLGALASLYGQRGKVARVMVAGHGESRLVQLGVREQKALDGRAQMEEEPVDLDSDEEGARRFLLALLGALDPADPKRRVVLHACLTNSHALPMDEAFKNGRAGQSSARRSLAEFLAALDDTHGTQITAAVAQGHRGNRLIGDDGEPTIADENDPSLVGTQLAYVADGKDLPGLMRAVVDVWTSEHEAGELALRTRLAGKPVGSEGPLIFALLRRVLARWSDGLAVLHIASVGERLTPYSQVNPAVLSFALRADAVPFAEDLLGLDPKVWCRFELLQVCARADVASHGAALLAYVAESEGAARFLSFDWFEPVLPALLTLAPASQGQVRIALAAIDYQSVPAASWLIEQLGSGKKLDLEGQTPKDVLARSRAIVAAVSSDGATHG